jgi:hypothetical protein
MTLSASSVCASSGKESTMKRFTPYLICAPIIAAAMLALGSCGGSSETSPDVQAEGEQAAAEATSEAGGTKPDRPDTYVPYRCSICSCRFFTGDGANCNRPSCQHHWTDHQAPSP